MSNAADQGLLEALLDSWERSNTILLNLLRALPEGGLEARAAAWPSGLQYTFVYGIMEQGGVPVPRTAKVFMTNRSQAVRLPKEYQFATAEVFIRKEGEDVILSPRPRDWRAYLEAAPVASHAFMSDVEDLPVQEREG